MSSTNGNGRGASMRLFSGGKFYVTSPRAVEVHLEDIAHALSRLARFAGHTQGEPYSVAQHSIHVSQLCDPADAMDGLFHDAAEAYVVDVPRPLKHSAGMENYRLIEDAIQRVIAERFGLKLDMPDSVHKADRLAVRAELRDLMGTGTASALPTITPLPWREAEAAWLARFALLSEAK